METVTQLLWAVVPSLLVGIFLAYFNHQQKKRDEHHKEVENERREFDRERLQSESLKLSLLLATAQLSYAVAMAIKRGTPNGEIEEGVAQYKEALTEFRKFEQKQLVKMQEERL